MNSNTRKLRITNYLKQLPGIFRDDESEQVTEYKTKTLVDKTFKIVR